MSTTTQIAPADSWLKISDDLENVLITHGWVYPVHVYVGASAPDANSAYHECTASRPFAMSGIGAVDVFIRSGHTAALSVTVTAI